MDAEARGCGRRADACGEEAAGSVDAWHGRGEAGRGDGAEGRVGGHHGERERSEPGAVDADTQSGDEARVGTVESVGASYH